MDGRTELNKLHDVADWKIERVRVGRKALPEFVQYVGNKLVARPRHNNKYFHLYTEFLLQGPEGQREIVLAEKNEKIRVLRHQAELREPTDAKNVPLQGKEITVREYFDNSKAIHERAGKDFERYSLAWANCSDFAGLGLQGNGLMTDDLNKFVYQTQSQLLPGWIQRMTDFITSSYAKISG